jgi:hypothetical protein
MDSPFGDCRLDRYTVNCAKAEIRLVADCSEIRRLAGGCPVATEILFKQVVAYRFEADDMHAILGWILETPLEQFLRQQAQFFETDYIHSAKPRFWNGSIEAALGNLQASSTKAYELVSAYGMGGWILAASYQTRPLERVED